MKFLQSKFTLFLSKIKIFFALYKCICICVGFYVCMCILNFFKRNKNLKKSTARPETGTPTAECWKNSPQRWSLPYKFSFYHHFFSRSTLITKDGNAALSHKFKILSTYIHLYSFSNLLFHVENWWRLNSQFFSEIPWQFQGVVSVWTF